MTTALQVFLRTMEGTKTRESYIDEVREQADKVCTCTPMDSPCYKHRIANSIIEMIERDSFWNELSEYARLEILYHNDN